VNEKDIKPFMVIDDRWSALVILGDYAVTIAVIVAAVKVHHPVATFIAMLLVAGRQVAFLNLLHSASHYSLFSKRSLNDGVDIMFGYLIFDAVRPYRAYHLQHHREFNRKDPERFEYLDDRLRGHNDGPWRRTWEVIIKPILGTDGFNYVRFTIEQARENLWWTWRLAAFWIVLLAAFWSAGWLGYLLLYWILPLVWLYPIFYNWGELTDHFAVKEDARNQQGIFYSLFLKGHEMYHAVHHKYPRIPFYRIKAASKHLNATGEEFEETRGVLDFIRILYRRKDAVQELVRDNFVFADQ